ncbi:PP2C family protein-serine/threonine phosphatase [Robbsia sp. KACC 23696]|uniref:PP2C family protein-serine/threonine phosphatase n=1 Tax=Robbsia sp. KACC 23696 TaxID=3149231 RepID=UPI00325BB794
MIGAHRFSRTRIERNVLAVTVIAMLGMAAATVLLVLALHDGRGGSGVSGNGTWHVRWLSLSAIGNRLSGRDEGESEGDDAMLHALLTRGWRTQLAEAGREGQCDADAPMPALQWLDGAHYGWLPCGEASSRTGQPKTGITPYTVRPRASALATAALSPAPTMMSASMPLERLGRQLGGEVLLLNLFLAPVQREGDGPRRATAAAPSPITTASAFAQGRLGRHAAADDADAWPADDRWPTLRHGRNAVQRLSIGGRRYWQIASPLAGPDGRQIAWIVWRTDAVSVDAATPAAPSDAAVVSHDDDRRLMARIDPGRLHEVVIGIVLMLSIGLLAILCVVLLRWSFGVIFAPLRRAMGGLRRLAEGRVDFLSDDADRDRSDEAGAIVRAAMALRTNLLALQVLRDERARGMQRQGQLLRAQLRTLAETLDTDDRLHIEQTLDALKAPSDSLIDLAAVLTQMTGLVCGQHDRLRGLLAEREAALVREVQFAALHQELLIARQMQMSILPHAAPSACDAAGLALVSTILPAREVGGDFYDYFMLDDSHLAIVIADVSGKGVPAAFFMAVARSLLKNTAGMLHAPAAVLTRLNALLCEDNPDCMFVTMFFGVLDLRTATFDYVNAGHNCPLRVRRARPAEAVWLDRGRSIALGVLADARYTQHREVLDRNDIVFFYTDGVTEACDRGDAFFGEQALHDVIVDAVITLDALPAEAGSPADRRAGRATLPPVRPTGADTARCVSDAVLAAVQAFAEGAQQADDITSIALAWDPRTETDATFLRGTGVVADDTVALGSEAPSSGMR